MDLLRVHYNVLLRASLAGGSPSSSLTVGLILLESLMSVILSKDCLDSIEVSSPSLIKFILPSFVAYLMT